MGANNISVDDLVNVPTGRLSDDEKNKLNGTKTKIAKVEVQEKDSQYGEDGNIMPNGATRKVMVAILETESIGTNALGEPITVKEEFNLKRHPVTGKYGPSLHEKSKSAKLFKLLKVNSFKECIGKEIVAVKKVSEKNANSSWLAFSL